MCLAQVPSSHCIEINRRSQCKGKNSNEWKVGKDQAEGMRKADVGGALLASTAVQ
jgi:hypothetical protein